MDKSEKVTTKSAAASPEGAQAVSLATLGLKAPEKGPNPQEFAVWVRALIQNWRQGTVASKGRSDVARSTKRPWKQKGTGRARAGTARSPLWRGGGVTFGPQARIKTLKVSKKCKKDVLKSMLADFVANDKVVMVDWRIEAEKPKTSAASALLKRVGLEKKKVTVFLPTTDMVSYASFANIQRVRTIFFDHANAFDLAQSDCWMFLKKDLDSFKEMVSKWS